LELLEYFFGTSLFEKVIPMQIFIMQSVSILLVDNILII
jgi:hypothetical protein